jgi:hypothetical protein
MNATKGASALQRGYAAGAQGKAIFRKKFASSSSDQNSAQAAHFSVIAGEFTTLREASRAFRDGRAA